MGTHSKLGTSLWNSTVSRIVGGHPAELGQSWAPNRRYEGVLFGIQSTSSDWKGNGRAST